LKCYNQAYTKLSVFGYQGDQKLSLFHHVNYTQTCQGKRLLRAWLSNPIVDTNEIENRYQLAQNILDDRELAAADSQEEAFSFLKEHLHMSDMPRIYRRFGILKMQPHEVPKIVTSNRNIRDILVWLKSCVDAGRMTHWNSVLVSPEVVSFFLSYLTEFEEIFDQVRCSGQNQANLTGNLFKEGYDTELDGLCGAIDRDELCLKTLCEVMSCRIDPSRSDVVNLRFSDKEGHSIETTCTRFEKFRNSIAKNGKKLFESQTKFSVEKMVRLSSNKPIDWSDTSLQKKKASDKIHVRIQGEEIQALSMRIVHLRSQIVDRVRILYEKVMRHLYDTYYEPVVKPVLTLISVLDVCFSNARMSRERNFVRPQTDRREESFVEFRELRHPVIEKIVTEQGVKYVPNDVSIDPDHGFLLYGVNSAGKSSLLKSIAISIILAQSGLFVPATYMRFSPYHKLFTRTGNDDNLFASQSSFTKEMTETKQIVRWADSKSLVVADELCASTEIDSAVTIVASLLYHLSTRRTSFMFATHLFSLQKHPLVQSLANLRNIHLRVRFEKSGGLIFERKLTEGLPENRRYGTLVASKIIDDPTFQTLLTSKPEQFESVASSQSANSKYNRKLVVDKCQICAHSPSASTDLPLDVHHINMQCCANKDGFIGTFHKDELHNLVPLCKSCHIDVHRGLYNIRGYLQTDQGTKLDWSKQASKKEKKKYSQTVVEKIQGIYSELEGIPLTHAWRRVRHDLNIKIGYSSFIKIVNEEYV
jgi:DNA mismatch repair protein MutS